TLAASRLAAEDQRAVVVEDGPETLVVGDRGVRAGQVDEERLVRLVRDVAVDRDDNRLAELPAREGQGAARGGIVSPEHSKPRGGGAVGGREVHRDRPA